MAAVLEQDKVIQTVVATLATIEELKPEQEECVQSRAKTLFQVVKVANFQALLMLAWDGTEVDDFGHISD